MPMEKILLQKFLFEIARQCRFCLTAYEDLNQALIRGTLIDYGTLFNPFWLLQVIFQSYYLELIINTIIREPS